MRQIRVLLMSVMAMLSTVAMAQDEALLWAEQLPQFPGGTQALAESIAANISPVFSILTRSGTTSACLVMHAFR